MSISTSMNQEARELFATHVRGKNILTPHLLGYGVSGRFAYELTEGKDMYGKPLYGVTVLERGSGYRRHDLSTCVWSLKDAEAHVRALE